MIFLDFARVCATVLRFGVLVTSAFDAGFVVFSYLLCCRVFRSILLYFLSNCFVAFSGGCEKLCLSHSHCDQ